jgi:hypothetical protein
LIEYRDLPPIVRRIVVGMPAEITTHNAVVQIRAQAVHSMNAAIAIWETGQWTHVIEQLSIAIGYLTAATRLEEEENS